MDDTTAQNTNGATSADQFHQDLQDDYMAEAYGDTFTPSPEREG
ncbi:hypothetical protein [Streptomyces sp. BRA346]